MTSDFFNLFSMIPGFASSKKNVTAILSSIFGADFDKWTLHFPNIPLAASYQLKDQLETAE